MGTTVEHILTSEQLEQFQRDGYIMVRGLFSPAEAVLLREHFMAMREEALLPDNRISDYYQPLPVEQAGGDLLKQYPRVMQPHYFDEISKKYLLDVRLESVLRDLFGEEPLAAQSMFYFKPPGARGQALHQDNFYLKVSPGTCMAAWVAVDDGDRDNGGMFAVPGTHTLGVLCPHRADPEVSFTTEEVDVPEGMEPVAIDLRAGDVLFFNGSVIHGSYPNTSADRFRRAFICHYIPASSAEMSHWYNPLLSFSGDELSVPDATGGGPCGTEDTGG